MNRKIISIAGLILLLAISCKDYLEPYPSGIRTGEDIWLYQENVQGLVSRCYDYMSRNYGSTSSASYNNEGVYLDGATDDAVITSSTNALRRMASGSLTTRQDPFLTYWNRDYQSIYLVNLFLKDRRGYKTRYLLDPHLNNLVRRRLQGEAYALRAWFQWDLLQKFGGKGINGEILGFPIITEPLDPSGEINYARNTYDECVAQIIKDCDSAYKYLPLAHRDFLVGNKDDLLYSGGMYWGRMDGISTRALKALVYLTWASPRFNPGNVIARWDSAAVNAKKVMDFKLNIDGSVANGFNPTTQVNWFNPNFPGIVFASRWVTSNADMEAMERLFYPGGFQGYGEIGATQELVNSFPDKDGYPINDSRSCYDPAKPYENRDPRFYSTIFYNTAQAKKNNTGATMYTFENWENGGKDAAGVRSSNSLTNYHIKKFVHMGLNWSDATINRQPHSKFFIRWTHMCLAFAEAANKVVGPTDDAKYGISARTAIQYLRARKTPDGMNGISAPVPGNPDPYLEEVANAGQAEFDILVKNERRIETCFEGLRFFDMRRWTTDLTELNKAVHGAGIIQNEDMSFTYNLNYEVEGRTYTSAYLPIPYSEILRMSKMVQNEGWDGWN
ncbi:MAG: RagB/SusD family nutrient uptake outer membrane protein [Bacteroidales bacterium]|nr:RagB/SusD family nutrient uptake outer membrane protein [Bacteroidales bacterium]